MAWLGWWTCPEGCSWYGFERADSMCLYHRKDTLAAGKRRRDKELVGRSPKRGRRPSKPSAQELAALDGEEEWQAG